MTEKDRKDIEKYVKDTYEKAKVKYNHLVIPDKIPNNIPFPVEIRKIVIGYTGITWAQFYEQILLVEIYVGVKHDNIKGYTFIEEALKICSETSLYMKYARNPWEDKLPYERFKQEPAPPEWQWGVLSMNKQAMAICESNINNRYFVKLERPVIGNDHLTIFIPSVSSDWRKSHCIRITCYLRRECLCGEKLTMENIIHETFS